MKIKEVTGKDTRELNLDIQELLKEQFHLRFKAANEELANTSRFRQIRREVAQIRTVLRQRELEAEAEAQAKAKAAATVPESEKAEA